MIEASFDLYVAYKATPDGVASHRFVTCPPEGTPITDPGEIPVFLYTHTYAIADYDDPYLVAKHRNNAS